MYNRGMLIINMGVNNGKFNIFCTRIYKFQSPKINTYKNSHVSSFS